MNPACSATSRLCWKWTTTKSKPRPPAKKLCSSWKKVLQPDLVLLDVLMPGIDGLQTLEQLRQLQPGVKVVMLSCVNDTRKVVHAMKLGAQDYLTKPFQKGGTGRGHRPQPRSGKAELTAAKSKSFPTTFSSSPPARRCARFVRRPRWWRTSIFPCCCWARAAPARKFSDA